MYVKGIYYFKECMVLRSILHFENPKIPISQQTAVLHFTKLSNLGLMISKSRKLTSNQLLDLPLYSMFFQIYNIKLDVLINE